MRFHRATVITLLTAIVIIGTSTTLMRHKVANEPSQKASFPTYGVTLSLAPGLTWHDATAREAITHQLDLAAAAHVGGVWPIGILDGESNPLDPDIWANVDALFDLAEARHLGVVLDLGNYRDWVEHTERRDGFAPTAWDAFLPFVVARYQSHPALAGWSLGGRPPAPAWGVITGNEIVTYYQTLARMIAERDPRHPITTGGLGELNWASGIDWQTIYALPNIDVAGVSVDTAEDAAISLPRVARWANEHGKTWIVAPMSASLGDSDEQDAQTIDTITQVATNMGATGIWYRLNSLEPGAATAMLAQHAVQPLVSNSTISMTPTATPVTSPTSNDCPQRYTAKFGESITQIATRYGIDWRTLWQANPQIIDPGLIKAGESICIPVLPKGSDPTATISGHEAIKQRILEVFGEYGNAALQVAQCESGFNPNAYNPIVVANGHAKGVFQIIDATWATTRERDLSPYDAEANIQAAWEIFSRDGHRWFEWVCQPHS